MHGEIMFMLVVDSLLDLPLTHTTVLGRRFNQVPKSLPQLKTNQYPTN